VGGTAAGLVEAAPAGLDAVAIAESSARTSALRIRMERPRPRAASGSRLAPNSTRKTKAATTQCVGLSPPMREGYTNDAQVASESKGGRSPLASGAATVSGSTVFGLVSATGEFAAAALLAAASGSSGLGSPSKRCLVMMLFGVSPRSCARSASGLRSSSRSVPNSPLSCSRAPVAYSRTCRIAFAQRRRGRGQPLRPDDEQGGDEQDEQMRHAEVA